MQVHKTKKAIAAAIEALTPDAVIEVTLKPITDPCWRREDDADDSKVYIDDADCDDLQGMWLSAAVTGYSMRARVVDVCEFSDGHGMRLETDDWMISLLPEHVRSLAVIKTGPLRVDVDGLRGYRLEFQADGSCKVGCQTLTRKGCEQAFCALAAHLGYEVTP